MKSVISSNLDWTRTFGVYLSPPTRVTRAWSARLRGLDTGAPATLRSSSANSHTAHTMRRATSSRTVAGGYAKYVGRVGALAVALGVGGAVATTPGAAWADDPSSSDSSSPASSSSTSSESTPASSSSASTPSSPSPSSGSSPSSVGQTSTGASEPSTDNSESSAVESGASTSSETVDDTRHRR